MALVHEGQRRLPRRTWFQSAEIIRQPFNSFRFPQHYLQCSLDPMADAHTVWFAHYNDSINQNVVFGSINLYSDGFLASKRGGIPYGDTYRGREFDADTYHRWRPHNEPSTGLVKGQNRETMSFFIGNSTAAPTEIVCSGHTFFARAGVAAFFLEYLHAGNVGTLFSFGLAVKSYQTLGYDQAAKG